MVECILGFGERAPGMLYDERKGWVCGLEKRIVDVGHGGRRVVWAVWIRELCWAGYMRTRHRAVLHGYNGDG